LAIAELRLLMDNIDKIKNWQTEKLGFWQGLCKWALALAQIVSELNINTTDRA
jgi:hypothetical protein